MFRTINNGGFTQLSLRSEDVATLRQLKRLRIIPSMAEFVHFLIIKEVQELKKQHILRKRKNIEDKEMTLTTNYDYALEQYINNYNDYMLQRGYKPITTNDEEIMEWIK